MTADEKFRSRKRPDKPDNRGHGRILVLDQKPADVGVYSHQQLLTEGLQPTELNDALASGRLVRLKRGWYASQRATTWALSAVRAGGRLGCLSGCKAYGIWTPQHSKPHIIGPSTGRALSPPAHRTTGRLPRSAVYPLPDCLEQVIRHHEPEAALMVLESSVNLGLLSLSDAHCLMAAAPVRKQRQLSFFDPNAASGSETRVRLFLQRHRFPVRSQAEIPGVGFVDFLVGRSTILECDSVAHHSDPTEDRRRDLLALELGYLPLRLSFGQIHYAWEHTQTVLLSILRTQKHLQPPRPPGLKSKIRPDRPDT